MGSANKQWLNKPLNLILWSSCAAFLTYSFMYAFRKPITAAQFDGLSLWGINYKVLAIITQVLGYLCSKFIGIRFISELSKDRRQFTLLVLIITSLIALLLFALAPYPWGFIFLFFNGLPLGLIWGIVYSYLEGRKLTDILAMFLSISFIFSSGFVKSLGRYLIEYQGISEFWMPFFIGALFLVPIIVSSWMLEKIPPPSRLDQHLRVKRTPMNKKKRRKIFRQFGFGLTFLLILNGTMTILRDIKDNFMVEIWSELSIHSDFSVFAQIETITSVVVLLLLMILVFVQNSRYALVLLNGIILLSLILVIGATFFYQQRGLSGFTWMVLHGIGLYTAYIAFQSVYFERLIAALKIQGNVGYLIYMADFVGYLASTIILIGKEVQLFSQEWSIFFIQLTYWVAIVGVLSTILSMLYFNFVHGK
jgi:MFS family permease